jgi:hypothetical protein
MSIYVTGDTHGTISLDTRIEWLSKHSLTKNDYFIICGDTGFMWDLSYASIKLLDWFTSQRFTTLFVDGNHECLSKDTEILTISGWRNIVDVYNNNYEIANFDLNTKKIYYDYPLNKVKDFKVNAISIEGYNTKQLVSLNHEVIVNDIKIKAQDLLNKQIQEKELILKGDLNKYSHLDISNNLIRLLTWVIMDGTIIDFSKNNVNSKKCTIQFKLSNNHKIIALIKLLKDMTIPYSIKLQKKSGANKKYPSCIRIYSDNARMINNCLHKVKQIPQEWRDFSKMQLNVFLDTLCETDATRVQSGNYGIIWSSVNKYNVDLVQEICIKNNIFCTINNKENGSGFKNGKLQYKCNIYYQKDLDYLIDIKQIPYNDYMYCFKMPLGTLITRLNGKVAFTGNCFNLIESLPVQQWNGGNVHFVRPNIIHLMRGQCFNIKGTTIFAFGGGDSLDKHVRTPNVNWWEREMPSTAEYEEGLQTLQINGMKVDYIVTHSLSGNAFYDLSRLHYMIPVETQINQYFDKIEGLVEFKHWYAGHYHKDKKIDEKHTVLFNKVKKLK